jgi:predicted ATPase
VQLITSGLATSQVTGTTFWLPLYQSYLAKAYAELGDFVDAWRCIGEATRAVETTKETTFEAVVYRIAGEIALKSQPDVAKAQAYFERALAVARKQQAKSLELCAAMSMAQLCCAPRWLKPQSNLRVRLPKSRPNPARPHCAVSKSSSKLGL